ncbi:uncharacterized protein LOC136043182 [Artemia franciscana]|uniref:uncharacterized protein LOC136043182 n=1 Tax=Artemia franciscana TaxID=6661 RepID=UPI0032DAC6D5
MRSRREEGGVGQPLRQNPEQTNPGRANLHAQRFSDLARHQHRASDCRQNSEGTQNSRSPGDDRITTEMLKCSMDTCVTYWKDFLGTIWTTSKLPSEWYHSTLVKLFKKGDATLCNNRRDISFLSIPGGLLSHIIVSQIQHHLDEYLRDEQHGFQPNHSCTDLVFTLRMPTEERCEWCNKLYMISIDFEKAFDSFRITATLSISSFNTIVSPNS